MTAVEVLGARELAVPRGEFEVLLPNILMINISVYHNQSQSVRERTSFWNPWARVASGKLRLGWISEGFNGLHWDHRAQTEILLTSKF